MESIKKIQDYMYTLIATISYYLPLKASKQFSESRWLLQLDGIYYFLEYGAHAFVLKKVNTTEEHRIKNNQSGIILPPTIIAQQIADVLGLDDVAVPAVKAE